MSTSGRIYHEFVPLLFLHVHREVSILAGALPEESEQFRFLRAARLANLKGLCRFDFSQILRYEGYYCHRFVYVVFRTFTLLF